MNKEQLFNNIKFFLKLLHEYKQNKVINFKTQENVELFRNVYKEVYPRVTPNLSCASCVADCLMMLEAWHEREYPKYLKSLPKPLPTVIEEQKPISEPALQEEVAEPKPAKPKNKRRKSK